MFSGEKGYMGSLSASSQNIRGRIQDKADVHKSSADGFIEAKPEGRFRRRGWIRGLPGFYGAGI
jgi:hypothetical protein